MYVLIQISAKHISIYLIGQNQIEHPTFLTFIFPSARDYFNVVTILKKNKKKFSYFPH